MYTFHQYRHFCVTDFKTYKLKCEINANMCLTKITKPFTSFEYRLCLNAVLKRYSKETTLSKYIWEIKKEYNEMPTLKRSIVKSVLSYSNTSKKKCLLCLQEKLEIINFEDQNHLLNKGYELASECSHANKYLFCNYKAND